MAEYIPITDQEIEPEAPITSILHHKIRDNHIAMFEGADGAPRLQTDGIADQAVTSQKLAPIDGSIIANNSIVRGKLKIGTGQVQVLSANVVRPSGALEIGHETLLTGSSTKYTISNGGATATASGTRGAWVAGFESIVSGCYYYNSYHSVSFLKSWLFLAVEKVSLNIVGKWFCNHHPSYGQSSFFEHPFPNIDLSSHDIFCINITKEDLDFALIAQYPTGISDDFLNPLINSFDDVNPFRSKRGIIEAFLDNFEINFSYQLPWATGTFPVGNPDFELGMDFSYIEIPKPATVTRLDYSKK